MFRLMEKARKNNKGFSLVELIVVVLIIAIIAVALAPQVVKYVQKSRDNVALNNAATIKSAVQAAVAEYQGNNSDGKVAEDVYTISYDNSSKKTKVTPKDSTKNIASGSASSLSQLISDNIGTDKLDYTYKVTVKTTGEVIVEKQ